MYVLLILYNLITVSNIIDLYTHIHAILTMCINQISFLCNNTILLGNMHRKVYLPIYNVAKFLQHFHGLHSAVLFNSLCHNFFFHCSTTREDMSCGSDSIK